MSVYFKPWVGSLVDEGIKGHKVLVLGESHYHDCEYAPECKDIKPDEDTDSAREERHQGITQRVVENWKDNPHRSPLSYRVPELFGLPKSEFWEHVAFYNYLQTFAGHKARVRPTEEQWDSGNARAFQTVMDGFKPDRILVLGKKTWRVLPSDPKEITRAPVRELGLPVANNLGGSVDVETSSYWYYTSPEAGSKAALAMPIMHPAAPMFDTSAWIEPVREWLDFSPTSKHNSRDC